MHIDRHIHIDMRMNIHTVILALILVHVIVPILNRRHLPNHEQAIH
jgi:hypothetical protein